MDNNPNHLWPDFRVKLEAVLKDANEYAALHMPGFTWAICEGYRSVARQQSLYAQGRTAKGAKVTFDDGVNHRSKHQSSCAADIVPFDGERFHWNDISDQHWQYLGHCARAHGLEWGGNWKGLQDKPHVQVPATDLKAYRAAHAWQKANGLG